MADNAEQAQQLTLSWQKQQEQIRGNDRLSAKGKQAAMARAYLSYAQKMKQLQDTDVISRSTAIDRLDREVFGASALTGADAISFRDAQDRAAQIKTPEEASALLRRATQSGDDLLAKAIGRQVWEYTNQRLGGEAWGQTMQAWADARPGTAEKLNTLLSHQQAGNDIVRVWSFQPQTPAELQRLSDVQLEELAQTDPLAAA